MRYRSFSSPKPFLDTFRHFFCVKCIARNDSAMTSFMSPRTGATRSKFNYLKVVDAILSVASEANSVGVRTTRVEDFTNRKKPYQYTLFLQPPEVGLFPILHNYFGGIFPESCNNLRKFTAHETKKTVSLFW